MNSKYQRRHPATQTQLLDNVERKAHEQENRRGTEAAHRKQILASQSIDAAYAKLTKTAEGTPQHNRALGGFISLLFPQVGPRRA
jgi:hypothetical protein